MNRLRHLTLASAGVLALSLAANQRKRDQVVAACPFCGSESVHVRETPADTYGPTRYQVQCGECACGTSTRYEERHFAIAAWNRRVPAKAGTTDPNPAPGRNQ